MTTWKTVFHKRINELFSRAKDKNYKLTLEEYAQKLGTTRNSLRGWLAGTGEPKSEKLAEIAKIEKVSVSWLVGETDDPCPYYDLIKDAPVMRFTDVDELMKALEKLPDGTREEVTAHFKKMIEIIDKEKAKEKKKT